MNSPFIGKFKVTSIQGNRTLNGKTDYHDGLDMVGLDSKNVYSTVNGVVEHAGWENSMNHKQGFGLYIRIKQNGSVDRYYFGHLSQINVRKGQVVSAGDLIGVEGSTGYATGSHVHYCVRGNASKNEVRNVSVISGIPNAVGTYVDNDGFPGNTAKIDVTYQTWDDVRNAWLPNVVNDKDYAGIFGHDTCAVYASLSQGNITYRVHAKGGKWYPAVTNRSDYAGVFNKPIDGLMMTTDTGKTIKYRVHLRRTKEWLPWVTGYNEKDHNNGYAGVLGQEIDAIQIIVQ